MVFLCFNIYRLDIWIFFVLKNSGIYSVITYIAMILQEVFYMRPLSIPNKDLATLNISSVLTIPSRNTASTELLDKNKWK